MEYRELSRKQISANLFVYGTAHASVDAICAGIVFSIFKNQIFSLETFGVLVIVYNILAFGLQTIVGFVSDFYKSPRIIALLGSILTGLSAFTFLYFPVLAIVLAGVGNACFHVGGGSICLNLIPKKASAPGIFVAPGALGLMIGTLLGKSGHFIVWPFVLGLFILSCLMFIVKKPEMNYRKEEPEESSFKSFELIILLIFIAIVIRSMVGMVIVFPWKSDINLLIILTLSVVLGKGLGGIIADRFGWIRVAVGALLLSVPCLAFCSNIPLLAIIGMFLFNITMPVTLIAISNLLPGRPGFAFGLACLALLIGTLLAFSDLKQFLGAQASIFITIFISLIALYYGLRKYFINFEH
jgi:MFS transporter, FSR family, fosmidomycin resistance protein